MSFPKYSKYKASGVEWLGEVPEGWTATPIKHLGRLKGGAGFPHEKQGVEGQELSFHKVNALAQADGNGLLLRSDNTITRETALQLGAFVFPTQTIVFAKVGAALLLGRIRLINHNACIDNNMMGLVVQHDKFCNGFVRHAMSLVRFDLIANPGAVPSLNEGQIGGFRLPVPPLAEQVAIATFLDRETAKIDGLIAEQRRLMELLKEKRQAVISHAVTKGLNPNAKMKPSGVEWLGDVPEHWEVGKLSRLVSTRKGVAFKADDFTDEGIPVVKASDIKGLTIRQSEICLPTSYSQQYPKAILRTGELVLSTVGSIPEVRNSAVGQLGKVPEELSESLLNQNTVVFTPSGSTLMNDFLFLILQTIGYRDHLDLHAHGTANQASINVSDMLDFFVPLPSAEEQIKIARFISEELGKFDTLTAEAQRAIDLLQERRTALISAAVTGQIDVRNINTKETA
jgi:type I restriction enzyme S subunit